MPRGKQGKRAKKAKKPPSYNTKQPKGYCPITKQEVSLITMADPPRITELGYHNEITPMSRPQPPAATGSAKLPSRFIGGLLVASVPLEQNANILKADFDVKIPLEGGRVVSGAIKGVIMSK